MNLAEHIAKSKELSHWINTRIHGSAMDSSPRHRLAAGCLDMVLEHQQAIVLLISQRLCGSATALVRPSFESYVRGVWLFECATEDALTEFQDDKFDQTLSAVIADIEKLPAFQSGVLAAIKKESWGSMCSYAHSGYLQVLRRNKEGSIEPNYTDEELIEVIKFIDGNALLATMEISRLTKNDPLMKEVYEKITKP